MTKEKRLEIYKTLLCNMHYDENCGNYESKLRQEMKKLSIPEKMKFEVKRIDEASYGNKVEGNSFDAALYLTKKLNGVVVRKSDNDDITHYYVAYLDEKGIVRVANPASDFIKPKEKESEFRIDIPLENFRKKFILTIEIGYLKRVMNATKQDYDFCKIKDNILVHNFVTSEGRYPSMKQLRAWGIDPNSITAFLAEDKAKSNCENIRTK